ncbi:MAG: DUF445 family protein, partial [Gammaproteobacteria bacterium]|nr:DUF445 family protein [Gammaproteobacteria bacterium]
MNKSLVSNLFAAVLILIGLTITGTYQVYILNTGLFALSGGITNWLAVHMLFERVPGLYGSGVIPLRFEEFKVGIRKLIMDQFFNSADLEAFFHGAGDTSERIGASLKQAIDDLDLDTAFESLLDVIMTSSFSGMLNMVGGRDALNPLKSPFVAKMRDYFENQFANSGFQDQIHDALKNALDDEAIRQKVAELIDQRLDQMTPQMVKEIIQEMIRKHLGWLVVWGCAFG